MGGRKEQMSSDIEDDSSRRSARPHETRGLSAGRASDAMVVAANVVLVGWQKVDGLVTAIIRGDVAAVRAATDAGGRRTQDREIVGVHVIPTLTRAWGDIFPID